MGPGKYGGEHRPRDLDDLEERSGQTLLALPAEPSRRTFDSLDGRFRVAAAMGGMLIGMASSK